MKNNALSNISKEELSKIFSNKKITFKERKLRGERFSKYLEYVGLTPSFIAQYKPTLYHVQFTESEICGYKAGGYGKNRKGFLSDNKAKDFIGLIQTTYPELPSPRFEYLVGIDNIMTGSELEDQLKELQEKISKEEKKLEKLKLKYSELEKIYLSKKEES